MADIWHQRAELQLAAPQAFVDAMDADLVYLSRSLHDHTLSQQQRAAANEKYAALLQSPDIIGRGESCSGREQSSLSVMIEHSL